MAACRFASSGVVRLPLTGGDWIEVREELTIREQKLIDSGALKPMVVGGQLYNPIDWTSYEIHRVFVWLVDWSLKGRDDKPVKLTIDAIKNLKPADFDEINAAITTYAESVPPKATAESPATASSGSPDPTENPSPTKTD